MRMLFLDPFHGGSHAAVSEGYARHSEHDITLMALPIAGGWRWRMRGAAVTFARQLSQNPPERPYDLIITTDMLDVATFLGLTREYTAGTPVALYFHENQLTYPIPDGRARDLAFPWMNYTSALAADAVFFNSDFHRRVLLDALPGLPGRYHDFQERDLVATIAHKAEVLAPGIDLARLDTGGRGPGIRGQGSGAGDQEWGVGSGELNTQHSTLNTPEGSPNSRLPIAKHHAPVILWNSRWEYDKAPEAFFAALHELDLRGIDFRVIVAGEHVDPREPSFLAAREWLGDRALAWGYAPDTPTYRERLHAADIVVSTAIQEFFGISVLEAMYCGCVPLLPHRLSYPEILPPELHADCLYDGLDDLIAKLTTMLSAPLPIPPATVHAVAARYDWSRMAPVYDAAFERIVHAH